MNFAVKTLFWIFCFSGLFVTTGPFANCAAEEPLDPNANVFQTYARSAILPPGNLNIGRIDQSGFEDVHSHAEKYSGGKLVPSKTMTVQDFPLPDYPMEARLNGDQGLAIVQFTILKNGDVADAHLIGTSSHEHLDQAALDAVSKWTFPPVLVDGVPVSATRRVNILFHLKD